MGNNYFSPNRSWFLPQFENHCAGQLTVNAELNSKPLIQWDLVALSKNEIQCLLKHSPEWKSQELITSEILTLKVSGLLVFLREVLLPVLSCTVWEELLNRSSHLNKEWKQQNFILLSSAVTAVSMAKQNESWIIIHYSQIMPVEGVETPCSSSSQDAVRVFWLRARKGQGEETHLLKQQQNLLKLQHSAPFASSSFPENRASSLAISGGAGTALFSIRALGLTTGKGHPSRNTQVKPPGFQLQLPWGPSTHFMAQLRFWSRGHVGTKNHLSCGYLWVSALFL